jgi:hypothetical protein|tara:strand:+ start:449 stop:979 length:531 start_codon:yes stop_codon:yes gene_type:complete
MKKSARKSPIADRLIKIIKSVTEADPYENNRDAGVVTSRQIFYKIMKDVESWSFIDTASMFGKDHATSRHGKMVLEGLMRYDIRLKYMYERCLSLHNEALSWESGLSKPELNKELVERDASILRLNAYIATLESKVKAFENKDDAFKGVFSLIRNRMPIGKEEIAIKKINSILNGI